MSLQLRWVGEEDLDRVAQTRMLCYAHASKDIERFREGIRADQRAKAGDYLLAERDGVAVGTATSLSMTMWVRGGEVPCQGVAWVGTIKTHRRRTQAGDGIATQIMRETVRRARERAQVVSALMPFRASYYEHFGYGIVERRNEWTVPLSLLPSGAFEGLRFYEPGDLAELSRFRHRIVQIGQCDIERSDYVWQFLLNRAESGFVVVDRPAADGPVRGFLIFEHAVVGTRDHLRVVQNNYEDIAALNRQLHFLASLRDQYAAAALTLPVDLPLHWLLRETQLPHRPVNHSVAELRQHTRMQVRILDHKRFLEAMRLPEHARGRTVVEIHECEGVASRFEIEISAGRAQVRPSDQPADLTCSDRIWAAVACGELSARRAVELGLALSENSSATHVLDALASGPAPFCHEYF